MEKRSGSLGALGAVSSGHAAFCPAVVTPGSVSPAREVLEACTWTGLGIFSAFTRLLGLVCNHAFTENRGIIILLFRSVSKIYRILVAVQRFFKKCGRHRTTLSGAYPVAVSQSSLPICSSF